MADAIVLITGASGHIGYACVLYALKAGHHVRCAVRSAGKADLIKSCPTSQTYLDQLSFLCEEDLHNFDYLQKGLEGVTSIIHTASRDKPPSKIVGPEDFVQLAVNDAISILKVALQRPQILRVVLTSCIWAIQPVEWPSMAFGPDRVVPDEEFNIHEDDLSNKVADYALAKRQALHATWQFMADHQPHFTIVNVLPGPVLGRQELAKTPEDMLESSNVLVLLPALGEKRKEEVQGCCAYTDDVGDTHVAALDVERVKGNQTLGVGTDRKNAVVWNDVRGFAKLIWPEAIPHGIFSTHGDLPTSGQVIFDCTATEEVLGRKLMTFQGMALEVLAQYLDLMIENGGVTENGLLRPLSRLSRSFHRLIHPPSRYGGLPWI